MLVMKMAGLFLVEFDLQSHVQT